MLADSGAEPAVIDEMGFWNCGQWIETLIRSVVSLFQIDRIRYAIVPVNRYNRPYQLLRAEYDPDAKRTTLRLQRPHAGERYV
ncbi:hypothetical protein HSR122_1084 [Halapricum desulfuricans]|uniref:Uncharacterized protein n=1 Tax=Halapricum desulfuricans TaxID=2841257 RepID=A0A897NAU0_9EURY|nr:hypothetical protein HSR122_1084 [Halapricum desulfuricans]